METSTKQLSPEELKDLELEIKNELELITDQLDNDFSYDQYQDYMAEDAFTNDVETLKNIASALDHAHHYFDEISGEDIVEMLKSTMKVDDIIYKAISCSSIEPTNSYRRNYTAISSCTVGEYEYQIDLEFNPSLERLVDQLPEGHHLKKIDFLTIGYPCERVDLDLDAERFVEELAKQLNQAILSKQITDTLEADEETV